MLGRFSDQSIYSLEFGAGAVATVIICCLVRAARFNSEVGASVADKRSRDLVINDPNPNEIAWWVWYRWKDRRSECGTEQKGIKS